MVFSGWLGDGLVRPSLLVGDEGCGHNVVAVRAADMLVPIVVPRWGFSKSDGGGDVSRPKWSQLAATCVGSPSGGGVPWTRGALSPK